MNLIVKWCKEKFNQKGLAAMSAFALCFATVAANVRCACHYHQPQFPESAKQLRKK
jgi:cyclic lactone autoinducer peptide